MNIEGIIIKSGNIVLSISRKQLPCKNWQGQESKSFYQNKAKKISLFNSDKHSVKKTVT